MANGQVDDLSWSQLRPRRTAPKSIIDSIPPEDMQAFLRLIATNPFLPFSEASTICSKIASVRQWRAEFANLNTVTKELKIFRPVRKRRKERVVVVPGVASVSPTRETDSEDEQPRRKQRRVARPALSSEPSRSESPQSDDAPKLGPEHQAEVPAEPLPRSHWTVHTPQVTSELVFSEQACGGTTNVNVFVNMVNERLRRRDGFTLAPFAMELALQILCSSKGNVQQAVKEALRKVPRGPYFPGIKKQFKYEEQCLFVRTLAERAKNFSLISRDVLPHRSVSELVWLYYTRHKQLWIQNGGMKGGLILDDGGEKLKRVQLTSERTISSLRNLAITAGDGFPIDSRVNLAVLACRRGNLMKRRKQREEEGMKGRTRLRNKIPE